MDEQVHRRFIPGDEWVYFKIYSGPKTLETVLINEIHQVVHRLLKQKIIVKFFFIRYADPDYHLRVRFHLSNLSNLSFMVQTINKVLKYYTQNRLVWKVCIDTYNRELERYGNATIKVLEHLFCLDSLAITNFLKATEENGNDTFRWLWGVKSTDQLLNSFGLTLKEKHRLFSVLKESYSKEFNMNKTLKIQLDKKYRKEMGGIRKIIEKGEGVPGVEYIDHFLKNAKPVIEQINQKKNTNIPNIPLSSLLSSIIHMHFNRLFRTKQRMHEMVIYYFMHKFYNSQLARQKYNPVKPN